MLMLSPLVSAFSAEVNATLRWTKRQAIVYSIVALMVLTAYVSGLVGIGVLIARTSDPATAAFLITAGAIAVALLAIVILMILGRIEKRRRRQRRAGRELATAAAVSALPSLFRSRSAIWLIAAGAAGYLAASALRGDDDETA